MHTLLAKGHTFQQTRVYFNEMAQQQQQDKKIGFKTIILKSKPLVLDHME